MSNIGTVSMIGMFDADNWDSRRPNFILKFAFKFGSSKQGNALRASVGCICEIAKYLEIKLPFEWHLNKKCN